MAYIAASTITLSRSWRIGNPVLLAATGRFRALRPHSAHLDCLTQIATCGHIIVVLSRIVHQEAADQAILGGLPTGPHRYRLHSPKFSQRPPMSRVA
ncbi:hypothetical protein [Acidihalobacter ferrooxydans]|uniref:hypothetical protein n=1 Tax=Acidihalobacter ferrooxydans TaxID=1765967 RepID=UPI0012EC9F2D|nr:hypothetical protein [Acidihalobacter ferrooxydans]